MDIYHQKQHEFFELADNLYIDCINKYRNLLQCISEIESKTFENEMRFICSQMGLACEYYLKGLIFPYLKIKIPEDKEIYRELIESLNEFDIYKILIGDDEILRQLSNSKGIRLKDLKFLQQYSIKSCGHDLLSLIDNLSSKEYADIPKELQALLFDKIKSYYYNYFGFTDDYKEINANENDVKTAINTSNIADAFVKGRYGHLDGYDLDYLKMIKLMHAIRSCCERSSGAFSIVNGRGLNGDQDATDITMVFPDPNSKIYVLDENGNVVRVYKYMKYSQFLDELYDLVFEKIAKKTNYYNFFSKVFRDNNKKTINTINELDLNTDPRFKDWDYYDLTLVPDYGISEMKRVFINHDMLDGKYYRPSDLIASNHRIFIDKDKKQTILLFEDNIPVSYTQFLDNKFRKNSHDKTANYVKLVETFEQNYNSRDEVMSEFVNINDVMERQIKNILLGIDFDIENNEKMVMILNGFSTIKRSEYVSYLRKNKMLKKERKKLLNEYKKAKSNLKEGKKK